MKISELHIVQNKEWAKHGQYMVLNGLGLYPKIMTLCGHVFQTQLMQSWKFENFKVLSCLEVNLCQIWSIYGPVMFPENHKYNFIAHASLKI